MSSHSIAFDGEPSGVTSFSLINRAWRRELERRGHRIVPASSSPDFLIDHDYGREFGSPREASRARRIAVRTSDFGPYPRSWVEHIERDYAQLWVHSRWVLEQAVASGIDESRVRLVPHGVDPEIFRSEGPSFSLPTRKRFKLLFVGGAIARKGIDILLAAYDLAFTRADDVALVVKDNARNPLYADERVRDGLRRRASGREGPELVYLDDHLPDDELASLYRAADLAVFPYRAEGFLLPALEALACGTPTAVPDFGACLDYSDVTTSFMLPVRRIRLPVTRPFRLKLGFPVDLEEVDFCEVSPKTLAESLRRAYEMPRAALREMGAEGAARAHAEFTWRKTGDRIEDCLAELGVSSRA